MNLKDTNMDKLTLENLEFQFCSDYLKDEIRELIEQRDRLLAKLQAELPVLDRMSKEELPEWRDRALKAELQRDELVKALDTLQREVSGTLKAHEMAIRYDSGNSNWNCLEMALDGAREALKKYRGEK